ncbi:hypothetical protein KP509_32G057700 [Ceratopteris richardii]|uniref:Uncharacterized protein n=1 Tax=Ceratopteris richardii TaxID=49495 RepID=A0A8T2QV54_CERRI|nr:hypothetical protein KP509_32G057700 [Ceratopteris richardii]
MADYLRYKERLEGGQLLGKRPRGQLDDVLLSSFADYGRGDPRYGERDVYALDYGLDFGRIGARYGAGAVDADVESLTALGLSGLDDRRLSRVNLGLSNGGSFGLKGGETDLLWREDGLAGLPAYHRLSPDASPILFVEGVPDDCA